MNNKQNNKIKIYIVPILIIALLTAIDQLTKAIISGSFAIQESKDVIKDVFTITYVQNFGIAWGMLEGKKILFLVITFLILGFSFYIYQNISDNSKFKLFRICMIVLMAGAIGNMIDRIKLGYVIDFFSFDLINFPVFNVADIYVVCSMIVIFILILFKFDDDDLTYIFKKHPEIADLNETNVSSETDSKKEDINVSIDKETELEE